MSAFLKATGGVAMSTREHEIETFKTATDAAIAEANTRADALVQENTRLLVQIQAALFVVKQISRDGARGVVARERALGWTDAADEVRGKIERIFAKTDVPGPPTVEEIIRLRAALVGEHAKGAEMVRVQVRHAVADFGRTAKEHRRLAEYPGPGMGGAGHAANAECYEDAARCMCDAIGDPVPPSFKNGPTS